MRQKLIDLKIITPSHLGRRYEQKVQQHRLLDEITQFTGFLNDNTPLKDRLYCIIHNITTKPKCKLCNEQPKLYQYGFNKYCSTKCSNSDPDVIDKYKTTCTQRYGATNTLARDTHIRKKAKRTMLERYGVEVPIHNERIKQKQQQTNLERYGVKSPLESDNIRAKCVHTLKERYGVEVPIHNERIKQKQQQTNLERYGATTPSRNLKVRKKLSTLPYKSMAFVT